MRVGSDRASDLPHGDVFAGGREAPSITRELGVMAGQNQAERQRLRMDAVRAADGGRPPMLFDAAAKGFEHRVQPNQQHVGGLDEE